MVLEFYFNNLEQAATGYASQNGGTKGGAGGTTTTVSSYAAFTSAVSGDSAKVVVVSGPITKTADQARVGSNTSIIGKDSNAILSGFGMYVDPNTQMPSKTLNKYSLVKGKSNVIIRNLGVKKVLADNGDAIGIREYYHKMNYQANAHYT
jgi:pectate lyase